MTKKHTLKELRLKLDKKEKEKILLQMNIKKLNLKLILKQLGYLKQSKNLAIIGIIITVVIFIRYFNSALLFSISLIFIITFIIMILMFILTGMILSTLYRLYKN